MTRSIIVALASGTALALAACAGEMVDREIDDGGAPSAPADEDDGGAGETAPPAGPAADSGPTDEPTPATPDGGGDGSAEPEADAGSLPVPPVDEDCVEPCGLCVVDVDLCCGYSICQDDWSGATHCMPVVPPHSGSCPTAAPEAGSSCPEPGLLCRYDGSVRCKCGCDGWNCPYGG